MSEQTVPPRRRSRLLAVLNGATFLAVGLIVAMLVSNGTWALWNGTASTPGAQVKTGSISLLVNGSTTAALAFPTAAMAPGSSRVAVVTFSNTGTVKISAVGTMTALSGTKNLQGALTLTATAVASAAACVPGLAGGTTASLSGWTNSAAPYLVPAGASVPVCFELKLPATASQQLAGGTAAFTLSVTGTQKRG